MRLLAADTSYSCVKKELSENQLRCGPSRTRREACDLHPPAPFPEEEGGARGPASEQEQNGNPLASVRLMTHGSVSPARSGSSADRLPSTSGTLKPPATHRYALTPVGVPPTRSTSPAASVKVTPGEIGLPFTVL